MNKILISLMLSGIMLTSGHIVYNFSEELIETKASTLPLTPDNTDILEDLRDFDLSDYVINQNADNFDIIGVQEYGYNLESDYYLYLYVFNESGKNENVYNFSYTQNRAEMYFYDSNKYDHIKLQFVSRTTDNRFIKYKINIPSASRFLSGEGVRTYGFVGIEISKYDEYNLNHLKDYRIAHKWDFVDTENQDVQVNYTSEFETLHIDNLNGGVYELGSSNYSGTAKNELYYVYFSVPSVFNGEQYGLYSIHADYYNFDFSNKLSALVDEHDSDFYNDIITEIIEAFDTVSGNKNNTYFQGILNQYRNLYANNNHWVANNVLGSFYQQMGFGEFYSDYFSDDHYRVFRGDIVSLGEYETLPATGNGAVLNMLLDDYILPISDWGERVPGTILANHFDLEKAERITGLSRNDEGVYNNIHYTNCENGLNDAEYVTWDLIAHQNNWQERLFGRVQYENITNISCIEKVNLLDVAKQDSDLSSKYLIDLEDIGNFRSFVASEASELRDTYIFRFYADYYDSFYIQFGDRDNQHGWMLADRCGYLASKVSIIVDFDIIDLTFCNSSNKLKVLPVISDPINIAPDLSDPSVEFAEPWWLTLLKRILMIIALVILVLLVIWVIGKIAKYVTLIRNYKTAKIALKNQKRQNSSDKKVNKRR